MKILIASLSVMLLGAPAAAEQPAPADTLNIEQQVQQFMSEENIPAIAVALIQNGKTVFTAGYGVRKRDTNQAINSKTLFQIGSQSKVLTSIITLELVKQGKLRLSDRVIDLLPDTFPQDRLSDFSTLTIEHLMVHRSGLPNYPENVTRIDGDAFLGGYDEGMLLQALKTIALEFAPDEKWQYSNFNYAVLGYALSKVSGQSYAQLVKHYIAGQYGLSDTAVELSDHQKRTLLATPYRKDDRQQMTQPWDMGLLAPHGGVYSTLDDLARLMEQQIEAYAVYQANGVASPLISTQVKYETGITKGFNYGLAMIEITPEVGLFSKTVLFHGGDLDGFGCEYLFSPELGIGVIMLTSSGGRKFVNFGRRIMEELVVATLNKPE